MDGPSGRAARVQQRQADGSRASMASLGALPGSPAQRGGSGEALLAGRGGRAPGVAPGARVRSAAEIRAAYGRPAVSMEAARGSGGGRGGGAGGGAACAAGGTQVAVGVMELNRAALEARGARLREVEEKGAELEASAAGFADLARQLGRR
jgi:hypothetical protein